MAPDPGALFGTDLPDGLQYRDNFITATEEAALTAGLAGIAFSAFEMHGVAARRRVAFFGSSYDAGSRSVLPMPALLVPLRERFAAWSAMDAGAFAMALVNEYPPGAPIGWHRDAPQYDIVAGVSLLSACRMKFRPYASAAERRAADSPRRVATHELALEPRSAYLMTGLARWAYEHHIPAVHALRYSITFRTLRR